MNHSVMKKILLLSLLLFSGKCFSQVFVEEISNTLILSYEVKRDTLFIYREYKSTHPYVASMNNRQAEIYHDRLVFIARQNKIVFFRNEPAKYRSKEVIEKKIISEEYW